MLYDRLLNDKAGKTAVGFHCLYDRCHLYQLAETLSSVFRHSKLLTELKVDLPDLLIICIRDVNQFTAISLKKILDVVVDSLLRTVYPVIAVKNIVRLDERDDIIIHHIVLDNDFLNSFYASVKPDPLFLAYRGEFVVADRCLV